MSEWKPQSQEDRIVAEELYSVITTLGMVVTHCYLTDDDVRIAFNDIKDAETLVSLGVPAVSEPGSFYDRVTQGCVTIDYYAATQTEEPTREEIEAVIEASWKWDIHPVMIGRRMDWHVSVTIPKADATVLTANLNAVRRVGR